MKRHTRDCGRCLAALATQYDEIPSITPLDITTHEWHSIIEIAKLVAKHVPDTIVRQGDKKDMTQGDKQNEPDTSILKYWGPEISLEDGICELIELYKKDHE